MRRSRNFRQGGPGKSDKKALTTFFLFVYFSHQLILGLKKTNGQFFKFQRGSNTFQGGPSFSKGGGGSNCLFPMETHIT